MAGGYESWGRYPRVRQSAVRLSWRHLPLPVSRDRHLPYLPFGNGRSYGDTCLNDGGILLDVRGLDHFIAFDPKAGILRCEAGVLLSQLLDLVVPTGWFPPVLPGTKLVTVGGAIASDVHGKNHSREGTFGRHVRCFELLRSSGERRVCSPEENPDWFSATIGGLGLTGVILWAEIALRRIHSPNVISETVPAPNLERLFEVLLDSSRHFEYLAAWIDCLARGENLGRGLLFRGDHVGEDSPTLPQESRRGFRVPVEFPVSPVTKASIRLFNSLVHVAHGKPSSPRTTGYGPFLFELDRIEGSNRLYGPEGFLQYHCVVPLESGKAVVEEMLRLTFRHETPSSLGVLKVFGALPSPGLLSFPRPGISFALDFPSPRPRVMRLLEEFDRLVSAVGGAVYPAKDARMAPAAFKGYYPRWEALEVLRDPRFSSTFWRRVTKE